MLNVNYAKILEQSGVFRYIMPEHYESIVEDLEIMSMKFVNNQLIFRKNDNAKQIAIVVSGVVKAENIHGCGTDGMAHRYLYGNIFGYEGVFSNTNTYPVDYISDGDSQIAFIDFDKIQTSKCMKELMHGIIGYMADESVRRMNRIEIISKKKLRDRIMSFLKIKEEEFGSSIFSLNLSREEMAQELCVNRSALSNELGKMQKEGILVIDGRKFSLNK